jgi:site-specific recombinase XerD
VEFLQLKPAARVAVHQFHRWLKKSGHPILQLQAAELEQFLAQLAKDSEGERARTVRRRLALTYFDWLHSRALLRFDPRCGWPRSNFPLPPHASHFLELLKSTHSLQTVRAYQTNLRQFHIWLNANHVPLDGLERSHVESWLAWLHARNLAASTRVNAIQNIRAYLEFLAEQGVFSVPADSLIRSTDLPRLPKYLPRPVPLDIDLVLQRRFKKSGCTYQLGLLLMRRTGMRISELMALPYRCIRTDHSGNTLLKVPLGKLATERLVPLDRQTVALVSRLRREGPRHRALLLTTLTGRKTRYDSYRQALRKACQGIQLAEPMTTHRLRHTYATSLLAAGMSLPAIMSLLGHSDYRMTLRYAEVTATTVFAEFAAATEQIAERYPSITTTGSTTQLASSEPEKLLADVARYVQKRSQDDDLNRDSARMLLRRLRRIQTDLRRLFRKSRR